MLSLVTSPSEKDECIEEHEKHVLSPDQQEALKHVLAGHNVFITGAGGYGKSFLIEEIYKALKAQGRKVEKCALTGLAANQIGGSTLHFRGAIGIGEDPWEKILKKLPYNENANFNWSEENLYALIVDEISMWDPYYMEKLDLLAQYVRGNKNHLEVCK